MLPVGAVADRVRRRNRDPHRYGRSAGRNADGVGFGYGAGRGDHRGRDADGDAPVYAGAYAHAGALAAGGVSIGIDPGHQMHADSGQEPIAPDTSKTKSKVSGSARGVRSGAMEYAVNLEVGLRLEALLIENGATVVMTRFTNDVRISNKERALMMNEANVDLVLRIHCNGNDDPKNHGAYMLVPSEKRTETYDYNVRAAQSIIDAYCQKTGIEQAKNDVIDRSDQTGFNWSTRPVVTIEMGFLTNPDDDKLLSDEAFWDTMAEGLYDGIAAFFAAEKP